MLFNLKKLYFFLGCILFSTNTFAGDVEAQSVTTQRELVNCPTCAIFQEMISFFSNRCRALEADNLKTKRDLQHLRRTHLRRTIENFNVPTQSAVQRLMLLVNESNDKVMKLKKSPGSDCNAHSLPVSRGLTPRPDQVQQFQQLSPSVSRENLDIENLEQAMAMIRPKNKSDSLAWKRTS